MKLILRANEEEFPIDKFRVIVDWNRMKRDGKGNPVDHMNILCYMEATRETRHLVLRNGCGLPKMADQYEKMKSIVKLAQAFGYKARRQENMPVLSLDKKDKYVIASIGIEVFPHGGKIDALTAHLEAGTSWPFEDVKFAGYMVEFTRMLNVVNLDGKLQQELAHTLTEVLSMFEFNIETGLDIGESKCSSTPESTDTSTPKEK